MNFLNMRRYFFAAVYWGVCGFSAPAVLAEPATVKITPRIKEVRVVHQGKPVVIRRNQNPENRISEEFSLTSRACPPHCLQPAHYRGVETVGELEVLDYLGRIGRGDRSLLVVDTRSEKQYASGTIPGSINVFGDLLMEQRGANPITIEEILTTRFGVKNSGDGFDFSKARTLVVYCYGIWCGQAIRTMNALTSLGYPEDRLKWYRGGMQAWESVGLTTVSD